MALGPATNPRVPGAGWPYIRRRTASSTGVTRVTNAKAEGELGWKPEFPSYREGLAAAR